VLLERKRQQGVVLPEFGAEVSVGVTKGIEDGLDKVPHGTCVTSTGGIAIGDAGHGHQFLSGGRGHESGTTGSRNQTNRNGTTLSGDLAGNRVGKTGGTSPVSTTDGNDIEFGAGDGTTNGGGDFAGALDSESDVTRGISDGDEGLESGALSGTALLLDGHDLHDLVLELVLEEIINDFGFLDGNGKEEDFFDGRNLSFLHETSEFGDGNPDVFVTASTGTSTASSSSTTATAISTTTSTAESAASFSSS